MTRSRDDSSNGNGPESEELQSEELASGDRLGEELGDAAALNASLAHDDGSALLPLLDAEAGPARPLAPHELLLLADRIERQFSQRRRPVSRLTPRRLLLAGGLFAASAAAAVVGVTVVHRSAEPAPATRPAEAQSPPAVDTQAEPARGVEPPPAEPSVVSAPSVAPAAEERPAEPDTAEEPGPEPRTVPKSSASSPPAANPAQRASRIGATGRSRAQPGDRQGGIGDRQHGTVAADRLAAANSLRSRHRYREALALYLQVIEIAPNGMQANVARVAAAEMQLEHFGDLAGAEHLYREARTQGGELTTEAQFGLSQVARARGDAPGERRALQDFLSRHSESPLAAAAKRRLNTLGER